jgi:RNA polymerase sigma-70 factor, ECF subfamily
MQIVSSLCMDPLANSAKSAQNWDWAAIRVRCLREARRMLDCERDAEEAVQEALLRAWRCHAQQREPGAELGWVLRITRNEALRSRARRKLRPEFGVDTEGLPERGNDDDPLGTLLAALDVRMALRDLTAEDVMLLRLRYERDLTQPRVAEVAGLPEGTVKVRLHRLRSRLRERLSEES